MNNDSTIQNLFAIQKTALETGNWEPLRLFYKPDKIKFILIGEAPPNGGDRFFYYDNVPEHDNLFVSVMSVLFPRETSVYRSNREAGAKRHLLNRFRDMGWFLMDLYPIPKDKKPAGRGIKFYQNDFQHRFADLKDNILDENGNFNNDDLVIILVHNAVSFMKPCFDRVGIKCVQLPFPLYGHQDEFRRGLEKIIQDTSNGKITNENP